MTTVVFAGPTLPAARIRAVCPAATVWPPARQGDVLRAVRDGGASVVALIDGAFLDQAAVWHREILWALERGTRVLGAASMGALRAAELAPFGMEGVGRVFAAYRDGVLEGWAEPFEDDDEVAVVHAPAALGHAPLSDAMVDLRHTLLAAEQAGRLDRAERAGLALRLKALHFPERSLVALQAMVADRPALAAWFGAHHASLKAADAVALLDRLAEPAGARAAFAMEAALVWTRFLARSQPADAGERVRLEALAARPEAWRRCALEALGRLAVLRERGPVGGGLDGFRARRGLWTHAALVAWAGARGLGSAAVARLAAQDGGLEAALAAARGPALDRAMLDVLHLEGEPP